MAAVTAFYKMRHKKMTASPSPSCAAFTKDGDINRFQGKYKIGIFLAVFSLDCRIFKIGVEIFFLKEYNR